MLLGAAGTRLHVAVALLQVLQSVLPVDTGSEADDHQPVAVGFTQLLGRTER